MTERTYLDFQALDGEPLRLPRSIWPTMPTIEPPSGPPVLGFAMGEAERPWPADEPLITREEYLAGLKQP